MWQAMSLGTSICFGQYIRTSKSNLDKRLRVTGQEYWTKLHLLKRKPLGEKNRLFDNLEKKTGRIISDNLPGWHFLCHRVD